MIEVPSGHVVFAFAQASFMFGRCTAIFVEPGADHQAAKDN